MKKFKFLIRLSYFIVLLEIFYYLRISPQVIGMHFVSDNIPDSCWKQISAISLGTADINYG